MITKVKSLLLVAVTAVAALVLAVAGGLVVTTTYVNAANWVDNAAAGFEYGGDGKSATDAIEIHTAAELAYLSKIYADGKSYLGNGKYYKLANDLDMSGHMWTPIGSAASGHQAKFFFDGAGKTISGLNVNTIDGPSTNYNGLFGYFADYEMHDLTVSGTVYCNAAMAGTADTAMLVGYLVNATVRNVTVNGTVQTRSASYGTAGIAGQTYGNIVIENCNSNVTIISASSYAAGIIGYAGAGRIDIRNCVNTGNIGGISYLAGIANGIGTSTMHITACKNTGDIVGGELSTTCAGIVSAASTEYNSIQDCINEGNVSCENYAAGIAARGAFEIVRATNRGAVSTTHGTSGVAGGIVAEAVGATTINASSNSGNITATHANGGIIGLYSGVFGTVLVLVNDSFNTGTSDYSAIGRVEFNVNISGNYKIGVQRFFDSNQCTDYVGTISYNLPTGVVANLDTELVNVHSNTIANFANEQFFNTISQGTNNVWGYSADYNAVAGYTIPYLKNAWIGEVTINKNGASEGEEKTFVADVGTRIEIDLSPMPFSVGFDLLGFQTNDGEQFSTFGESKHWFTIKNQYTTLYAQFGKVEYLVVFEPSGTAYTGELLKPHNDGYVPVDEGAGDNHKVTIGTDRRIRATTGEPDVTFSAWQVLKNTATLPYTVNDWYNLPGDAELDLNGVVDEWFVQNFAISDGGLGYQFIFRAYYDDYWQVSVKLNPSQRSMGSVYINDVRVGLDSNEVTIFRFPKTGAASFTVESIANPYFRALGLAVTDTNGIPVSATSVGEGNKKIVPLLQDIVIEVVFAKNVYNLQTVAVDTDFNAIDGGLVLGGASVDVSVTLPMEVGMTTAIRADVNVPEYRFVGFEIRRADGGYDALESNTAGILSAIELNSAFFDTYLDGNIVICAVFQRRYQVTIELDTASREMGRIEVLSRNGDTVGDEIVNYTNVYLDAGTQFAVRIMPDSYHNIKSILVAINGGEGQSQTISNRYDGIVDANKRITISLEVTTYVFDVYSVSMDNKRIAGANNISVSVSDANGGAALSQYVALGRTITSIVKDTEYEANNRLRFVGWYYVVNGALVPLATMDGNLYDIYVDRYFLGEYLGLNDTVTIVAKFTNLFTLDVLIAAGDDTKGSVTVELKNEKGVFEIYTGNTFVDGSVIRITAAAKISDGGNLYYSFLDLSGFDGLQVGEVVQGGVVEIVLLENRIITTSFESLLTTVTVTTDTKKAKGEVDIICADDVKVGDIIVVAFKLEANYQINSWTINGVAVDRLPSDSVRRTDNTVYITVTEQWLDMFGGRLEVGVSTTLNVIFLVVLLGAGVLIPVFVVTATVLYTKSARRRKQLLQAQKVGEQRKKGFEAVQNITDLSKFREEN